MHLKGRPALDIKEAEVIRKGTWLSNASERQGSPGYQGGRGH